MKIDDILTSKPISDRHLPLPGPVAMEVLEGARSFVVCVLLCVVFRIYVCLFVYA